MRLFLKKVPNGKQIHSCKKSDQNGGKNQCYETLHRDSINYHHAKLKIIILKKKQKKLLNF